MTNKEHWEATLARYLDGQATAQELDELERGARVNPALRRAIEQGETLLEALERLPAIEPPRDLVAAAERELIAHGGRPAPLRAWLLAPVAVTAIVAVVVLAGLLWWSGAGQRQGDDAPTIAPRWMVATAVNGKVWVESAGVRREAFVGDVVKANSRIETEAEAELTLALGKGVEVTLEEQSRIGVIAVNPRFASLLVEHGLVAASSDGRSPLELRLRGALHTVRIELGEARLLHAPEGTSAVACAAGTVAVNEQQLNAGFLIDLRPGLMGEARPIPASLELAMDRVAPLPKGTVTVNLSGETNVGAELRINGERVKVGPDGRFTFALDLEADAGQIVALVRDVLSRRQELRLALETATPRPAVPTAPSTPIEMEWEWVDPGEEPG